MNELIIIYILRLIISGVIIYARCSTDENKQDVEVQLKELRRYCEAYGWKYDEVWEYGSGYKLDNQPKLDETLNIIADSLRFNRASTVRMN